MALEIDYLLYVTAQDGELAVMPGRFDDLAYQIRLQRELLLLLGPYAASVGFGKWIGACVSVEYLTKDLFADIAEIGESRFLLPSLILDKRKEQMAVEFGDYRIICNFTKSEYLFYTDDYRSWLTTNLVPGRALLDLLTTRSNKSWSGCEIAVTPTVPPWMRRLETPPYRKASHHHGTTRAEGS